MATENTSASMGLDGEESQLSKHVWEEDSKEAFRKVVTPKAVPWKTGDTFDKWWCRMGET